MAKKEDKHSVIPADYAKWLGELKSRIRHSQIRALVKVNEELLALYWNIGSQIVSNQSVSSWGTAFIAQLSRDLTTEFPEMKGFSPRNLAYCKNFYLFYSQENIILHQAGAVIVLYADTSLFPPPSPFTFEKRGGSGPHKGKRRVELVYHIRAIPSRRREPDKDR